VATWDSGKYDAAQSRAEADQFLGLANDISTNHIRRMIEDDLLCRSNRFRSDVWRFDNRRRALGALDAKRWDFLSAVLE
jgi:hypothetical protein